MLTKLDLTLLVERLNPGPYAADEILIATLNAADALAAPGGFTHACVEHGLSVEHITRFSLWKIQCEKIFKI